MLLGLVRWAVRQIEKVPPSYAALHVDVISAVERVIEATVGRALRTVRIVRALVEGEALKPDDQLVVAHLPAPPAR